jgi:hypothetical protein
MATHTIQRIVVNGAGPNSLSDQDVVQFSAVKTRGHIDTASTALFGQLA